MMMSPFTFYSAFLATLLSVTCLSRLAWQTHNKLQPRTLSELAATELSLLKYFRIVLWLCGTLFAITIYWLVVPRTTHPVLVAAAWSLEYIGNLALAVIPARGKTLGWHTVFAQVMAAGMLSLAYLFWINLPGAYSVLELVLSLAMTILVVLMVADRRRFIFYELPFIFLSHGSILVAVLALR